jgi:hypothetical protein
MEENIETFDEMYQKYADTIEKFSNGIVKSDKVEFLKMYAFYETVICPTIVKFAEAASGVKLK